MVMSSFVNLLVLNRCNVRGIFRVVFREYNGTSQSFFFLPSSMSCPCRIMDGRGRGRGRGRGAGAGGINLTPAELANIINQSVTAAIGANAQNQNAGGKI